MGHGSHITYGTITLAGESLQYVQQIYTNIDTIFIGVWYFMLRFSADE